MHALNSRELKALKQQLADYYGFEGEFKYVVFITDEKKYYIATRDVEEFLNKKLRIERLGVYFGQDVHGELRLSIEGSQLLGPDTKQNIIELTAAQRDEWMLGKDVVLEGAYAQKFHIVRCGNDYLGCGKFKKGVLQNYVPKERYVGAVFTDDDLIGI